MNGYVWSQTTSAPVDDFLCVCVGCCRECGMCSIHPSHTPEICALKQRQADELEQAIAKQRVAA